MDCNYQQSPVPTVVSDTLYLLSVCNMLSAPLQITSIHFTKKTTTHAAVGKDTPCKFYDNSMLLPAILYSDLDSLGHPRKLTAFIFYGAAFVLFWQCQWKTQADALSYGYSQFMRPAAGRWREAGCRLTSRQTTMAAKIAVREVLMVCCQGDKDQPGSISFVDANEASELLLTLA